MPSPIDPRLGFSIIPRGLERIEPLIKSGAACQIYVIIANRARSSDGWAEGSHGPSRLEAGQCFIGTRELTELTGRSRGTVLRALRRLEKIGLITRNPIPQGSVVTLEGYREIRGLQSDTRSTPGTTPETTPGTTPRSTLGTLTKGERGKGKGKRGVCVDAEGADAPAPAQASFPLPEFTETEELAHEAAYHARRRARGLPDSGSPVSTHSPSRGAEDPAEAGSQGPAPAAADETPHNVVKLPARPLTLDPPRARPLRGEERLRPRDQKLLQRYREEAWWLWDHQERMRKTVGWELGQNRIRERRPACRDLLRIAERLHEHDRDTCMAVLGASAREARDKEDLSKMNPSLVWSAGGFAVFRDRVDAGESKARGGNVREGFADGPRHEASGREFVLE